MVVLNKFILSGFLGGVYGFSPGLWKVSFLLLFPLMKNQSSQRVAGYAFSFYAVSMLPVALVSFGYSREFIPSVLAFGVVLLLSVFLMTACFSGENRPLFLLLKIAAFFSMFLLPPFSSFSFSSPLWLSGVLFPGFGLLGVGLFIFLIFWLRYKPFSGGGVLCILLAIPSASVGSLPVSVVAISTSINQSQRNEPVSIYTSRIDDLSVSKSQGANVVYFPESHFGVWHSDGGVGDFFKDSGVLIIGGLNRYIDGQDVDGVRRYRHAIADLTNNKLLYSQEISPSMFDPNAAKAEKKPAEIINVLGAEVGFIICWESLDVSTLIDNLMSEPEYVVLFANTHWSKYYKAGDSLSYHFRVWARLFGVPSLVSINSAPRV